MYDGFEGSTLQFDHSGLSPVLATYEYHRLIKRSAITVRFRTYYGICEMGISYISCILMGDIGSSKPPILRFNPIRLAPHMKLE